MIKRNAQKSLTNNTLHAPRETINKEKIPDRKTLNLSFLNKSLKLRKIFLSSENSSANLFTTLSKEAKHDPYFTINNSRTPVMSQVKKILRQF